MIWLTTWPCGQVLQRPDQVRQVDPVHRRAVADVLLQERRSPCPGGRWRAAGPGSARCRWPTSSRAGAFSMVLMMYSVEPIRSAFSTTSCWHSGCTRTCTPGDPRPDVVDGLRGEPAVHRAVALPQDHLGGPQLLGGQAAVRLVRVVDHAVVQADAQSAGRRCCGPGAGRGRTAPSRRARRPSPARVLALDDVQTTPPCLPQKALMSAEEFM